MFGIGIGLAFSGGNRAYNPVTYFGSSVLCYLDASLGVTMGDTLSPSGDTPPAVTVSGSGALGGLRVWIDSIAGGTDRGQATFSYGFNNDGATATAIETGVPTAASYPLIGAASGYTLAFAAGPYAANNVWQGTCSQIADRGSVGVTPAQATATKQPLILVPSVGMPRLRFESARQTRLQSSTYASWAQPQAVAAVFRYTSGYSAATYAYDSVTKNRMAIYRVSATVMQVDSGAGRQFSTTPQSLHQYGVEHNGTSSIIRVDGVPGTVVNLGTGPGNGVTLGGSGGTATGWSDLDFYHLMVLSRIPTAAEWAMHEKYVRARWGTP